MNNSRHLNLILKLKDEVSGSLDRVNKKMESLQPTFKKMALIGTASFLAIGTGIYKATQQAVDAQEVFNKFNVVFQDVSDDAEAMAQDLRNNFGMAESTAKDLLSATGDMLTGFGLSGKAALDLAGRTNKLAVDLASFTNIQGGAERASKALTKALLGERESVKELGIAILEEDVKAKVLSMRATGQLTNETERQSRALATLEIAISQSQNAIGDFARTQDTLANQQRTLNERLKEVVETLGGAFIPLAQDLMNKVIPLVATLATWVQENPKLAKNIILVTLAISALVAGIGLIGIILPGIITLVGLLTISMLPLILVILGFIATLGVLAVYWVKHFDDIKSGMDGFMEEWNGFFDMIVAKQQSSTTVLGMTWEEYFKNVRIGMGVMWDAIFKIIFQGVNNNINLMEGLINSIIDMIDNLLGRINRVGRRVADFLGKDFKSIELIGNIELPRITQEVFLKRAKEKELGFIGPMNQSVGQPSSQNINSNTMDIGGSTIPMARTRSQVPAVNINIQQMIGEEEYAEKMGDKIIQSLKQNQLMTSI